MRRTNPNSNPGSHDERHGLVLIIVLIVVVMVSMAGFGFVAVMFTEHKAVRLRGEQLEIEQAIASAEVLLGNELTREQRFAGVASISLNASEGTLGESQGLYDNPTLLQGKPLIPDVEDPGVIRFTVLSPKRSVSDGGSTESPGESSVRYGVEDESSRLNLAVLAEWERRVPGSGKAALTKFPGMSEEITDAILDWLDPDDQPRELGAEEEYYSTLNPAYSARNGIPESIEELLLVKGVTRKLLYGMDVNRNGLIEEYEIESGSDIASGDFSEPSTGWEQYLTLYSREANVNSAGRPRIFLNDRDLPRLYLRLSAIEKSWGEFIVLYRQHGAVLATAPLPPAVTTVTSTTPDLKLPPKFHIHDLIELIDAKVLIPAVGSTPSTIIESPFKSTPDVLSGILPKMLDELTIDHRPVIEGRINLNTASAEILGMIPGLPVESIQQIVSSQDRMSGIVPAERKSPAWLWTENLLDRATFQKVLPFVTCRGGAFRAQVVGYSAQSKLAGRAEVVIDVSSPSPRRLYWKDLQIWGRGYEWGLIDPALSEGEFPEMGQMAGRTP